MPAAIQIEIGERFGSWVVIGEPQGRRGKRMALCRCVCGTVRRVLVTNLHRGVSTRCGNEMVHWNAVLVGDRFGSWVVITEPQFDQARGYPTVRVRCDCGTERTKKLWDLTRSEGTRRCQSCGATARNLRRASSGSKGMSGTPTYSSWQGMNHRCYVATDVAWRYYGAKGIRVCDRWRSESYGGRPGGFERFLEDMGERPEGTTLDRINPAGDYEPSNCRWATPLEQTANRRLTRV